MAMCEYRNLCLRLLNTLPLNINLDSIYNILHDNHTTGHDEDTAYDYCCGIYISQFTTFIDICKQFSCSCPIETSASTCFLSIRHHNHCHIYPKVYAFIGKHGVSYKY